MRQAPGMFSRLLCLAAVCLLLPVTLHAADAIRTGALQSKSIRECSGIVASREQNGLFWILSDSGNPANLYAIDAEGNLQGSWALNTRNRDWEDIAIDDEGHLYVGDTGNNGHRRDTLLVHRVREPKVDEGKTEPLPIDRTWNLRFPEGRFDCESLFIEGEHGYLISKVYDGAAATLFRFPLNSQAAEVELEKIARLPIRLPATAADLDEHDRLIVASNTALYRFPPVADWRKLEHTQPAKVAIFQPSLEAICAREETIIGVTEAGDLLRFTEDHFETPHSISVPEAIEAIFKALHTE